MSWAASKAVDHGSRRRALRAYFLASEAPVIGIRDLLLADVLAHLLQLKTNCGHRVAAGPEMLTREIFLLSAQPGDGNGALPLQKPNHRGHRVFGRNRDTICVHGLASGVPPESDTPSASPARGRSRPIGSGRGRRSLSGVVWARTLR